MRNVLFASDGVAISFGGGYNPNMPTQTETPAAMPTTQATEETPIAKAVRLVGGIHAGARIMGIAPSTVCHRIKAGYIPMPDAMNLELKTGVPVEDMIPSELFDKWFAYRIEKAVKAASKIRAAA